jgi:predicted 3-demethylubiquinone-9 3-methyltransferase (glyoxalase superfamily)
MPHSKSLIFRIIDIPGERGREAQCGWLKDKYGLSWQIVPTILSEMLNDAFYGFDLIVE